jgi:hypothetical protein
MVKKILIVGSVLFGIIGAQNIFAASCSVDHSKMLTQVHLYHSISTQKCPLNWHRFGVAQVVNVKSIGSSCKATCRYERGAFGSCSWAKGNWGDTLACHFNIDAE